MNEEETKCPECKAYHGQHSPQCSNITLDEAKRQLAQYYELWLTKEMWVRKRSNMWREQAERWKGKFIEVKHENNQLRKKVM